MLIPIILITKATKPNAIVARTVGKAPLLGKEIVAITVGKVIEILSIGKGIKEIKVWEALPFPKVIIYKEER